MSSPILIVLFLAALIVFLYSYPNVPGIAEETNDYRNKIKHQALDSETEKTETIIKPPASPTMPNTITPVVSPEDVNDIVNPKPEPKPKPTPADGENNTIIDTNPGQSEPPLEIKLLTGILNVAPLIIVATLGGFGIYLLFKYKKQFTLRSMFGSAIGLVAVCTLIFFGFITFSFIEYLYGFSLDYDIITWIILPSAIVLGGWLSYNIISKRTTVFKRNIGLSIAGSFMGAFLASFLPFWIIFILLIAITLFDIYSVKFGPIKKIMELDNTNRERKIKTKQVYRKLEKPIKFEDNSITSSNSDGKAISGLKISKPIINKKPGKDRTHDEDFDLMLMYDNPEWSLGLGDFVIYSMFTSAVLTYFMIYLPYYIFYSPSLGLILPWIFFIICGIGIIAGFLLTLKLLEKRDYLPGLPISIGLGFVVFILCIVVLQVINYILYSEFTIII